MFKNFYGYQLLEAYQKMRKVQKDHPLRIQKKLFQALFVVLITLFLWNVPADFYGMDGLTVIQQRIISIFAFATLMWIMEVVPSWATSVAIMGLMLVFPDFITCPIFLFAT